MTTLYPPFFSGPDYRLTHAHDIYLQVAVDYGLGGLVACSALLTAGSLIAWRAYMRLERLPEQCLVLGLAGGLLAQQSYGLTDAITLGDKPSVEWWVFLGLVAGLYARVRDSETSTPAHIHLAASLVFGLWAFVSLMAIALAEAEALAAVALALCGGCAVGLSAVASFEQASAGRDSVAEQPPVVLQR